MNAIHGVTDAKLRYTTEEARVMYVLHRVLMIMGGVLGFTLMAVIAITVPLWLPMVTFGHWLASRRELAALRAAGRLLDWQDLRTRSLEGKSGTLILEDGVKSPTRYWWTPDDLGSTSPHPVPPADAHLLDLVDDPFMAWLWERYTGPSGSALFAVCPEPSQQVPSALDHDFPDFARIVRSVRRYEGEV